MPTVHMETMHPFELLANHVFGEFLDHAAQGPRAAGCRPGACGPGACPRPDAKARIRVDIVETAAAYKISAELPGVPKEAIAGETEAGELKLSVAAPAAPEDGTDAVLVDGPEERFLRNERRAWRARNVALPEDADLSEIEARFENGLLSVVVKKKPAAVPKSVTIM